MPCPTGEDVWSKSGRMKVSAKRILVHFADQFASGKASSLQCRNDKILVDAALRIWASVLIRQTQANKLAFMFYDAKLAERAITTWRSTIPKKSRLTKQAKLVRQQFL